MALSDLVRKFIYQGPFAYQMSLKISKVDQFVGIVKREKCETVEVAGKLNSPGLSLSIYGELLFAATMSNCRSVTYTERLFESEGDGSHDISKLFLALDLKAKELQTELPDTKIDFTGLFMPNGKYIAITAESRKTLRRLSMKSGVV